jgi:tetratricopeptide (TPR) repeat protein
LRYTEIPMSRLETLSAMLSQDPGNTFARYGLAMEFANQGRFEESVAEYGTLLERDPNYAAAYYHGGQALERLGRVEEARDWYERGIQVTGRNGDAHTQSELQAALDLLPL